MGDAKRHHEAGYMARATRIGSPQVLVALPGYHIAGKWDAQPSPASLGAQPLQWLTRKVSGRAGTSLHRGLKNTLRFWVGKVTGKAEKFLSWGVNNSYTRVQQTPFTHGTPPHFNAALNSAHAHILSDSLAISTSQPKVPDPKGVGCFPSSEESSTPTRSGLEKQLWKEKMDQIQTAIGGAAFACRLQAGTLTRVFSSLVFLCDNVPFLWTSRKAARCKLRSNKPLLREI